MTAKIYLQQYLEADSALQNKLEEIQGLEELLTKITQAFGETQVQLRPSDYIGAGAARLADARNEAEKAICQLVNLKQKIETAIFGLPEKKMGNLLFKRYVLGKTFEQIAADMNYSWRQIHRLHKAALAQLETRLS